MKNDFGSKGKMTCFMTKLLRILTSNYRVFPKHKHLQAYALIQ